MLPFGSADLRLVEMSRIPTCGTLDPSGLYEGYKGIWTEGISDCVVVVIAEPDDAGQRWSKFCFQHMPGGDMTNTLAVFEKLKPNPPNPARCWAVFADKSNSLVGSALEGQLLVAHLVKWGVSTTQIKWYTSGGDFKFGYRFGGGYLGEV